jgi:hypothetical protein
VSFISVDPTAAVALLCAPLMLISASITQKSRDSQGRTEGEKWKLEVKSRIYFELLPKRAFSNCGYRTDTAVTQSTFSKIQQN